MPSVVCAPAGKIDLPIPLGQTAAMSQMVKALVWQRCLRWAWSGLLAVTLLSLPARGQVTVLFGHMNVDNAFSVYLSTSDDVLGTLVASGNAWPTTYNFQVDLAPGVINYVHVVTTDYGAPAAFLGDFSLSNTAFHFTNGTQSLLTAPGTFQLSTTGFGSGYTVPTSSGTNGVGPWGFMAAVNASAQWLAFPGGSTAYFSAAITPVVVVPEPLTVELLAVGALALGLGTRRRWRAR